MPRFYFDLDEGESQTYDAEGTELTDLGAAHRQALRIILDIARDQLRERGPCEVTVRVRDETGGYLFQVTLALSTEWLHGSPPGRAQAG